MTNGNPAALAVWSTRRTVISVAISLDGTRLASGSMDCSVRVWDVHTGALILRLLQGHTDAVRSVAFSPDNALIVSSSNDASILIRDSHTGAPVCEPSRLHGDTVHSVSFSHDSSRVVSGSADKTIRIWDIGTGTPVGKPLQAHTHAVRSVAFSHDDTRIVSGSADHTVRIWDTRTGATIGEPLEGHTHIVFSVSFSPNDIYIVSGSADKTIRIWDTRTGAPMGKLLEGHSHWVWSVAFSDDGFHIVSGSADKTIRIWDIRTGAPICEPLEGHTNMILSVTLSPRSTHIFSSSTDGTIRVWQWQVPQNTLSLDVISRPEPESPVFDTVTSKMSVEEIFDCLVKHKCADFSQLINPARYSKFAIATGGFGDVWQAELQDGTLVAVKCLRLHAILEGDEKGMKRMARELYHWSKARHENIQELLGIVTYQSRLGMVSLWMENGNLQQYIERNPSVNRFSLCTQVAKGVAYMHEIGMVHGDIKALNILVSGEGIAKISDFDYSILSESTLRFSQTSKVGGGTIRWMAPELLLDQGDNEGSSPQATRNKRTDVYALGMTMLETISGLVPYHQIKSESGIIRALMKKQPPKRPQELSESEEQSTHIWALMLTCWNHDPLARPHAFMVLRSLQTILT